MNQLVFYREKESNLTFIKKVSLTGKSKFFIFPPKFYHNKHHHQFISDAVNKSKTKLVNLKNLSEEIFGQYYRDNKFVFKGIELWEDFEPDLHLIKYRVPVLKESNADKLCQLSINLNKISFMAELDDPVIFINTYKSLFKDIEFDMQYLVDYLPKKDMHQFDQLILNGDFNGFTKLFVDTYTPPYVKSIKESFDKSLNQFKSIEQYVKSKYDLFTNHFQMPSETAIKFSIFSCPINIVQRLYKKEYLSNIDSVLRNCKLADATIDFNYINQNNLKEKNLINIANQQAEKEQTFMSPLQELFKKHVLKQQSKKNLFKNSNKGRQTDKELYDAVQELNEDDSDELMDVNIESYQDILDKKLKKVCVRTTSFK